MLEDSVVKVIPIVAIPTIISMLIDSLYNITDTYFVSSLGTTATAAVGVNSSLMHLLRSVAMGFGIGRPATYLDCLEQGWEANRVGTTTLFTGLIALMAISLIGYIFIPPIVRALGATDTVMPYSMDYARWILLVTFYRRNGNIKPAFAFRRQHQILNDRNGFGLCCKYCP